MANQNGVLNKKNLLAMLDELEEAVVVVAVGEGNKIEYLNRAAAKLYNMGAEQVIGSNLFVLTKHELDIPRSSVGPSVVAGKEKSNGHVKLLSRENNDDLWVEIKTIPLVDESGQQIGLIRIVHDVTEQENEEDERRYLLALRSEAEIAARTAWQELNRAIDFIRDPFFLLNSDLTFNYLNRSAEAAFGKKAPEVIGRSIEEVFPTIKKTQLYRNIVEGETDVVFTELFEPLGVWIDCSIYSRKGEYNQKIGVHFKDISESVMLERELSESEVKYRQLINSIRQPFFALNHHLRVIYWNEDAEKLTGIPAKVAIGRYTEEVFPQISEEQIKTYFAVLQDKKPRKFILNMEVDNNECIFEVYVYPSTQGLSVLCKDTTESTKLEEELKNYNEQLQQLVEERTKALREAERMAAIGQTAGMVGHDIRNPLQAIISATYLAKEDLTSIPQSKTKESLIESMKEIEEQTNYINKIVLDLQDYARPLNPVIEEVDLRQLLDNLLRTTEIDKNIKIISEIANDIQKIHADPTYLQRILNNLITNSKQAMPNGGTITITATKQNGICLITVEDTGEGIPEEIKPRLFTPLFTTKSKGQGFGLAASKRLAIAMGGDLTFTSTKGNGAKFTITLPTC